MLTFLLLLSYVGTAQPSPVRWDVSSRKITDDMYEVSFTARLSSPWHIYSQTSPAEAGLPTRFRFTSNPLLMAEGPAQEKGKMVEKYEEVFDTVVRYFEQRVEFLQVIKLKTAARTNLSGSVSYMLCNEEQCMPAAVWNFSVPLQ